MKRIPLSKGKFSLVDDEDYEWLSQWKWHSIQNKKNGNWYANRSVWNPTTKKKKKYYMHREILGLKEGDKTGGEHRNGDGLNNQKYNLRICTQGQNVYNQKARIGGTSKYKGVTWHKGTNKWTSKIGYQNKKYYLGIFKSEIDAAEQYDIAAQIFFREFAKLNFPFEEE